MLAHQGRRERVQSLRGRVFRDHSPEEGERLVIAFFRDSWPRDGQDSRGEFVSLEKGFEEPCDLQSSRASNYNRDKQSSQGGGLNHSSHRPPARLPGGLETLTAELPGELLAGDLFPAPALELYTGFGLILGRWRLTRWIGRRAP